MDCLPLLFPFDSLAYPPPRSSPLGLGIYFPTSHLITLDLETPLPPTIVSLPLTTVSSKPPTRAAPRQQKTASTMTW